MLVAVPGATTVDKNVDVPFIAMTLGVVSFLIVFFVYLFQMSADIPRFYVIPLTGLAALAFGSLIGFLYANFGDETERFGAALKAVNGLIAGFTLADATQTDGIIRTVLRSISYAAGLNGQRGLILVVIIACASAGILFMYQFKRLYLNRAQAEVDHRIEEETTYNANDPSVVGRLQEYWKPSGQESTQATNDIRKWLDSHALDTVAVPTFINGSYAAERAQCVADLKIS